MYMHNGQTWHKQVAIWEGDAADHLKPWAPFALAALLFHNHCWLALPGLTAREICEQLGFRHCLDEGPVGAADASDVQRPDGARGAVDFLDLLFSMKVLCRTGEGAEARYTPHPDTARYLLDSSPDCITGILALNHDRLSVLFNYLEDGLRHGQCLRPPVVYAVLPPVINPTHTVHHPAVLDIGGPTGCCCVALCERHLCLKGVTCDLLALNSTAQAYVDSHQLSNRVQSGTRLGRFSDEPFPEADVIIMGMVLHDWGLARKQLLISKAKAALRPGGALIAVENLVDDERRQASAALASSLNMLLEFGREAAFDFSFQEFKHWTQQQGFRDWLCLPLVGSTSAAVAFL